MSNIYRVQRENGGEFYVEECDPQGAEKPEGDFVYVCTRTRWSTSMFGQVESCGWIERSKLEPLNLKLKGDRQIVEDIKSARDQGKELSKLWFDMQKAKEVNSGEGTDSHRSV